MEQKGQSGNKRLTRKGYTHDYALTDRMVQSARNARSSRRENVESRAGKINGASQKARSGTFCTRISPGCQHCYASTINKRFGNGLEFTVPNLEQIEFFIDERILEEPLRAKKPCTIFVGDMFDLFHEAIPVEMIGDVFDAMAQRPAAHVSSSHQARRRKCFDLLPHAACRLWTTWRDWTRPNVWLGVSVESQKYADERIPLLLQTPAAVRFLSVEPMLEAVDLCSI